MEKRLAARLAVPTVKTRILVGGAAIWIPPSFGENQVLITDVLVLVLEDYLQYAAKIKMPCYPTADERMVMLFYSYLFWVICLGKLFILNLIYLETTRIFRSISWSENLL